MTKLPILVLALALLTSPCVGATTCDVADYEEVSQAELLRNREAFQGKKVQVTGSFLFSGSDFCYQIRKTKINTRDYFCFAIGTPSLVRLYLKKDHHQVDELLNIKKGRKVTAYGIFDSTGRDYSYMVVDEIAVEPTS